MQLRSVPRPLYRVSAALRMAAIEVEAKTFNNSLSFERGLLQRQKMFFASVLKTGVLD